MTINETMNSLSFLQQGYTPNPIKSWVKKDKGIQRFYVYILKLDSGKFYVGQTRKLLERISEHREGQTISTAGANPKLRYFEILPTRIDAMSREHELKRLARSDTREMCKMIRAFHDLISEIDID
jgi:predicted GIY-YIG superfamily endonuclease